MKCPNCPDCGGSEYPSDNQTVFQVNGKMMCLICDIEVRKSEAEEKDSLEETTK